MVRRRSTVFISLFYTYPTPNRQVYDCDLFKVTHVSKYPGPITALAVAPDCSALAVGTYSVMLNQTPV
jgi:hypothetical protein